MTNDENQPHTPVLLDEVLNCLQPQAGDSYLDVTAGYGGHAAAVLERSGNYADSVLVDRDQQAIDALQLRFNKTAISFRHADFLTASRALLAEKRRFDLILADLGVSSLHLNQAERGFSFAATGPLDMRMDQTAGQTAADIVNTYSEADLTDLLRHYGEEPKARQIARLIVAHRPFNTTVELANVVKRAWPGRSRVHPATRTFQALRIAVNNELSLLEDSLPIWVELLKPGGRLAIISFHSLEDRIVKQFLADRGGDRYDASLKLLTKRPLIAAAAETVSNPRARSAKLRAAAKINKQ